jgi:tRNA (guanine-N7-)-methyltransferase
VEFDFFKNDNLVSLELGCGKGEYSVGLASKYPNKKTL